MQPVKIDRKALPMSGLACYICHEANKGKDVVTMGYTQKCHADGCDRRMHVTCAQDNGLLHVPLADGILDRSQKDDMVLYCATHKETTPESSPGKVGRKSAEQPGVVLQDGTVIRVGDHIKVSLTFSRCVSLFPCIQWCGSARCSRHRSQITSLCLDGLLSQHTHARTVSSCDDLVLRLGFLEGWADSL